MKTIRLHTYQKYAKLRYYTRARYYCGSDPNMIFHTFRANFPAKSKLKLEFQQENGVTNTNICRANFG